MGSGPTTMAPKINRIKLMNLQGQLLSQVHLSMDHVCRQITMFLNRKRADRRLGSVVVFPLPQLTLSDALENTVIHYIYNAPTV